jgi:hypothetical protein
MAYDMRLKLTLRNESSQSPLHLTSLAPRDGWKIDPPHHLDAGQSATCEITTASELAVTMRYGKHHIGLHVGNGAFSFEPGDAKVIDQKLDGNLAELALTLS